MTIAITNSSKFINHLQNLGQRISNSVSDPKALMLNLRGLTDLLSNAPHGAIINGDIAQKCLQEEAWFRQSCETLCQELDLEREALRAYIYTNNMDGLTATLHTLTNAYNAWQNYYSRETHNESLLARCHIIRDAITDLAEIANGTQRPHLAFVRNFGKFRDDGTIESLKVFEQFSYISSDNPIFKQSGYNISNKWGTLVSFHNSNDPEQFIRSVGPHVLNSHAQAIIDHAVDLIEHEQIPDYTAPITKPDQSNIHTIATQTSNVVPILPQKGNKSFNHQREELTILGQPIISFKECGDIRRIVLKEAFNKQGWPKKNGAPFDVIHEKLGRSNEPFKKGAKDSIHAAIKGLNKYIEGETGGAIKKFFISENNTLFVNSMYLPLCIRQSTSSDSTTTD
jgi:hypothetical protein